MNNKKIIPVFLIIFVFVFSSCLKTTAQTEENSASENIPSVNPFSAKVLAALSSSELPQSIITNINTSIESSNDFQTSLEQILQQDPYLRILVDKERALPSDYEPSDLAALQNASYRINRNDLSLRTVAAQSLEQMARAARSEGLTLVASSSYRSYEYQVNLFARHSRNMGEAAASMVSARAGHSQHQLGTVIDFGSITNEFANTREGIWLSANAARFGWSLSYPQGFEQITGYSWESWHFRYVGIELAQFIDTYFEGIQQYALRFIHEFEADD